MLVLSRKVGEEIVIGGGIRLTVLSVEGRRVRVGIVAPQEVPVRRQEVLLKLEGGDQVAITRDTP